MSQLLIVIVNWNGLKFLPDCLRSIAENPPGICYQVVVVDNASTDGSSDWLRSELPNDLFGTNVFRLIESGSNLGFGKANNLAFGCSRSKYVFLLNPDTVVLPRALDRLIEAMSDAPKIGMAVPRVVNQDGTLQPSVRPVPNAFTILANGLQLYRLIPKRLRGRWLFMNHWAHDEKITVPSASGCAMFIRREALDEVGGFDPQYFMYGEDADLCIRFNRAGWKILFEPDSVVVHISGGSSSLRWDQLETRMKESEAAFRFQRSALSPVHFKLNLMALMIVSGVGFILNTFRGRDREYFRRRFDLGLRFLRGQR